MSDLCSQSGAPSSEGNGVPILMGMLDLRSVVSEARALARATCLSLPSLTVGLLILRLLRADRFLTRPPLSLTQATGLQRLDHAQRLFGRTANIQIVNDFVAQYAFRIDDEQAAQRDALVVDQHTVILRHLLGDVCAEREPETFD